MKTDKTGLGPKPSSNAGLPKPSDGWYRGKAQPALWMKKKMKKESCFYEDIQFEPYEKLAKEICYLLDIRPGSRGENHERDWVETETLKSIKRFLGDEPVDWERLEELAKNYMGRLYNNYSQEYNLDQEARLKSLLSYLPRYFKSEQ